MPIKKIACPRLNITAGHSVSEVFVRFDAQENPIAIMCNYSEEIQIPQGGEASSIHQVCSRYDSKTPCIFEEWKEFERTKRIRLRNFKPLQEGSPQSGREIDPQAGHIDSEEPDYDMNAHK